MVDVVAGACEAANHVPDEETGQYVPEGVLSEETAAALLVVAAHSEGASCEGRAPGSSTKTTARVAVTRLLRVAVTKSWLLGVPSVGVLLLGVSAVGILLLGVTPVGILRLLAEACARLLRIRSMLLWVRSLRLLTEGCALLLRVG